MHKAFRRAPAAAVPGPFRPLRALRVRGRRALWRLVRRPRVLLLFLLASAAALAAALASGAAPWAAVFAAAWLLTCAAGFRALCSLVPDTGTRGGNGTGPGGPPMP